MTNCLRSIAGRLAPKSLAWFTDYVIWDLGFQEAISKKKKKMYIFFLKLYRNSYEFLMHVDFFLTDVLCKGKFINDVMVGYFFYRRNSWTYCWALFFVIKSSIEPLKCSVSFFLIVSILRFSSPVLFLIRTLTTQYGPRLQIFNWYIMECRIRQAFLIGVKNVWFIMSRYCDWHYLNTINTYTF